MADVFDNEVEQHHRARLWNLVKETPYLTWLILTKRIGNAAKMLPGNWGDGYPNVQLGITVVTQAEVDRDAAKLFTTPVAVHFLSIEPMLEKIDVRRPLSWIKPPEQAWIIAGGESGPGARSMRLSWVRFLRDQCQQAGVPFFVKQLSQADTPTFRDIATFPVDLQIREFPDVPLVQLGR